MVGGVGSRPVGMTRKRTFLVLLVLLNTALSIPLWNEVNKYTADGDLCPPVQNKEEACPAICVYDLNNCPHSPSCPDGQSFCSDGKCHDECTSDISSKNPCYCGWKPHHIPSAAKDLVPCPLIKNVTIPRFYQWNSTDQIRDACFHEGDIDNREDYGSWGKEWPRHSSSGSGLPAVLAECLIDEPQEMYTFHEPMWIAVFTIVFGYIGLLGLWYAFKLAAQGPLKRMWVRGPRSSANGTSTPSGSTAKGISASSQDESSDGQCAGAISKKGAYHNGSDTGSPDEDDGLITENTRISGYRNNIAGTIMAWLLLCLAIIWVVYMLVLTADYYGSLAGKYYGTACWLSYDDCNLGNQTFIVMWCLFVFLVVTVNVTRYRLRNFFRIKTAPQDGDYVCVEQKIEAEIMLENEKSFLLMNVRRIAGILKHLLGWDWNVTTAKLMKTAQGRKYFTYQCTRFVYDENDCQFAPFSFNLGNKNSDFTSKAGGLTSEEAEYRGELIGPNFIEVYVPNWFFAFIRQITSFIALYQSLSLLLMYYDFYWKVGLVNTCIIFFSFGFGTVVRKLSEERLKRLAEHEDQVIVRRDGKWVEISSRSLVPGDILRLTTGMHMSCDCILVAGNAVVDEASLTGEALPVRKFPLRMDNTPFNVMANKNNQLYSGTIISQVQPMTTSVGDFYTDEYVLGLVARTGTSSDKGKLVRKILFPQRISFIFDEQLKVVLLILVCYAIFCMGMAIYFYKGSPVATWFYGMFCMLQAISPLLPAGILAGQSMAAIRLKRKLIFCVDPQRIMMAGKVQIFCFDKTGTLTKEGLEYYGGKTTSKSASSGEGVSEVATFDNFNTDLRACNDLFQMAVASCHAVTDLNGQYIGNPVDIEQFNASKWSLDNNTQYLDTVIPPEGDLRNRFGQVHIVRRFEFVHARASMSVAVKEENSDKIHVFVKGSFERIKTISNSDSIPSDYDYACANLAGEGCYVLSVAHKVMDISADKLKDVTQDELEGGCNFLGLLIFKNMLKEDTEKAIRELKGGSTRTSMITGDTALTGIYIARQCGMIPPNNTVLLGDIDKKLGTLLWTNVDTGDIVEDVSPCFKEIGPDGFPMTELAVTSSAFQHLDNNDALRPILLNTRVFARMKPNDKVRCVKLHMERGVTAMCGDGGNDCGALRAAHVGLALSDAEASIVSPFSSSDRSVMSCVELLIQSRAGLATSFANYRALILYGTTMTFQKLVSFYWSNSMSQPVWIIIDSLIATSMAIAVTFLPPARKLAKYRPTARILGPEIMASVLGVVVINCCFMACVWVWLFKQSFYRCHEFDPSAWNLMKWYLLGDNIEAAVMSYIVLFQFINNGFMVNYGYLYRRTWFYNPLLLALWAMLIIIVSYAELGPPSRLSCTLRVNCGDPDILVKLGYDRPTWSYEEYSNPDGHNVLPSYAKWTLWGYSIGNMVAGNIWQLLFVYGPVRNILRKRRPLRRLKLKF